MAFLHNEKELETGLLLSQNLSFKAYKTYITAICFLNCTKTKLYDVHLRLRLMLQTRIRYAVFVARQSYQRGSFAMGLKLSLHHH